MNNLIKEWAVKANPGSKEIYSGNDWPYNSVAWSGEELAKFAELVRDACIDAAQHTEMNHVYTTFDLGQHKSTIQLVIKSIKEKINVQ